jgi:hypothetical protein
MQPTSFIMKDAADIVHHEACMQPISLIMKHAADIAAGTVERQAFCD